MKKIVAFFMALITVSAAGGAAVGLAVQENAMPAPVSLSAPLPSVSGEHAILYSPEDGAVLYAKNAETRAGMASTTKIMTGYLCAKTLAFDRERVVQVPAEAVGVEGSSAYLAPGEELRLLDLLYALMLQSANDAATAIAILLGGSVENFVADMNRTAEELGLANTHFQNPHGLSHEEHYTTAYDLARLTAAALENELFATVVGTRTYVCHSNTNTRTFSNHNRLLSSLEGVYGVKTGFTKATGRCLVSAAQRNGVDLIAVTLNAPDDWRDHEAMFDFGFASYRRVTFLEAGGCEMTLPVVGGKTGEVTVRNPGACSLLTADADLTPERVTLRVELPAFVYAPLKTGAVLGRVAVLDGEKEIGFVSLVATSFVEAKEAKESRWDSIKAFFRRIFAGKDEGNPPVR